MAAGSAANLFDFGTNLEHAEGLLRLARNHATSPAPDSEQHVSMEKVADALSTLVRGAYLIRDHLTPEAWRALGVLENPAPIAQHLVNIIALAGVLHESITHDRSWALIMLGRRLERGRFLLTSAIDAVDVATWQDPLPANSPEVGNFLRLHDSVLSFRRHSQFRDAIPSLVELLLLSRSNPRSLAFCLDEITNLLATLPEHGANQASPGDLLNQIEAVLASLDVGEQGLAQTDLSALLHKLHALVTELFQAVRTQQFGQLGTALWTAEAELQEEAP
ncbi:MAG TPA: alpha-E domain-containing protein [Beutenbergiaceae bacterium]|nr:alpha-E domain-containing protein [Beutenbergiaceae bacterium]